MVPKKPLWLLDLNDHDHRNDCVFPELRGWENVDQKATKQVQYSI